MAIIKSSTSYTVELSQEELNFIAVALADALAADPNHATAQKVAKLFHEFNAFVH